jgi:hypothetical protein
MRLQPLLHAHAVAASGTYGYSPCHIRLQVSDPIRFPEVLDISPYTRDGAATAAGTAAAGTAAAGTATAAAAAATAPGSGRYRLTAILMHTGTSAHSGHYTARIMEQPPGAAAPSSPNHSCKPIPKP